MQKTAHLLLKGKKVQFAHYETLMLNTLSQYLLFLLNVVLSSHVILVCAIKIDPFLTPLELNGGRGSFELV